MLMLTVILLVMVAERIDAACSMAARKLAGAAMAAESKMRSNVKPVPDVMVTVEPAPLEPLWLTAAWASTDSAGMVGVGAANGDRDGGYERLAKPASGTEKKLVETSELPGLRWFAKGSCSSCKSEMKRDFIA
jgi:hypothetical protein